LLCFKKTFMIILLSSIFAAATFPAFSSEGDSAQYYEQGSQVFSFKLGPNIHHFIWQPFNDTAEDRFSVGQIYPGGYGSIGWNVFMNSDLSLGAEIGYAYRMAVNREPYTTVPVLFNLSYFPNISGDIDVPITLGIGGAYHMYDDLTAQRVLSPIIVPKIQTLLHTSKQWAFGLEAGYWFIPEIYLFRNTDRTSFASFLELSFSIQYTNQ